MGLFGRKKSRGNLVASSYAPPTNVVSSPTEVEAVVSNGGDDAVMVPSVGSNDRNTSLLEGEDMESGEAEDASPIVGNQSILTKASGYLRSAFTNNSTIATGLSADGSMHSEYSKSDPKSVKDQVMDHVAATSAAILAFWFSLSKVAQVALLAGAAIGAVTIVAVAAAGGGRSPAFPAHINVAFVGNSYFYANDLPRFVENIAGGHVTQDSVVHNAASILQVIMTGNGMWNKWDTANGMINGAKFDTYRNTTEYLYDMGACSVPQLLTGSDDTITVSNKLGSFIDDGQNPCFQQDAYREYKKTTKLKHGWDFVVLTDQSKAMAFDETREDALMAFNYTYGPILKKKHITPIIVQPHAYSSAGVNSASSDDLATFTALIMEGAHIYRKYLNKRIGVFNHAHIAPVGNAFMAVYEESPNDLWPKLFLDDGVHPSAYGTFVYGCVIYATMTGYMPKYKNVVIDDMENSVIFANARRLQSTNSNAGFPTKDEAAILYKIAKKVAIRGYKPAALKGFKIEENAADFLLSNSDNVYQGNYASGSSYAQNSVYNEYDQYNQYNGYQNNAVNYDGDYGNNNNGNNYNVNNNYESYQQNYNNNANANANGNYNGDYNNGNNYQVNNNYNNNNANGNYNGDYNNGNNNANGNYNGDYNNGNNANDDANDNANGNYDNNANGNYNGDYNNDNNYQVNNYNYQENDNANANANYNGNYDNNDNNGNDNGNDANGNDNNNGQNYEAAQQYYNNYQDNKNNNNDNTQYGGGNQNKMQYYYQELTDDSN